MSSDAAMPRGKEEKVEISLGRALPYLTLGTYVGGRRYIGGRRVVYVRLYL